MIDGGPPEGSKLTVPRAIEIELYVDAVACHFALFSPALICDGTAMVVLSPGGRAATRGPPPLIHTCADMEVVLTTSTIKRLSTLAVS